MGKSENIKIFKGIKGIKEVYRDTLNTKSHLLSTLQPSKVEPKLYKWLTTDYVKERVKRKIFAFVFVSTKEKDKTLKDYINKSDEELRKVIVVDPEGYPFEMEIIIYDNKVAFVQYNPKYELGAILIESAPIANTMRSIFLHYLWKI
jgi:hypothetical protein